MVRSPLRSPSSVFVQDTLDRLRKNVRVRVKQFLFKYNSCNVNCRVKGDFGSVCLKVRFDTTGTVWYIGTVRYSSASTM